MPITVSVANRKITHWPGEKAKTAEDILRGVNKQESRSCKQVIQSDFSIQGSLEQNTVSASSNGLVWAAYHAYSSHHHLTIRPEDVWFAIVTQLSSYINANAEEMRDYFVDHSGQKDLVVIQIGTIRTVDFGDFAQQMTDQIAGNIKDPGLRDWILPSFTTTTQTDRVVGSVLLMGAMQQYFKYYSMLCCGLPSVTLLGEVADYEDIMTRLDKLEEMGAEPYLFAEMLRPILRHMILTFKEPTSPEVRTFWNKIAHREQGSGIDTMSGWITAFSYWDDKGTTHNPSRNKCAIDGVSYPELETSDIAGGFVTVPVLVDDNGAEYNCRMLAGSIGIQAHAGPDDYVPAPDVPGSSDDGTRKVIQIDLKLPPEPKLFRTARRVNVERKDGVLEGKDGVVETKTKLVKRKAEVVEDKAEVVEKKPKIAEKKDEVVEEDTVDLSGVRPVTGWMIYEAR